MDINRLRYFRAMVEAGGLSPAAKVLSITPGALSKALSQLESELAFPLFKKSGRRLVLTERGQKLYDYSTPVVLQFDQMIRDVATQSDPAPFFRIATFEVFSTYLLAEVVRAVPGVKIQVQDVPVPQIEETVASGHADLGFTYTPTPRDDIELVEIGSFEFGVFGAKKFRKVPFGDLPFCVPISELNVPYDDAFAVDCWPGLPRKIEYRLTSLQTALALTRTGQCVCFLPGAIARAHNVGLRVAHHVVKIPVPKRFPKVTRRVFSVRSHTAEDVARNLENALRDAIAAR